MMSKRIALAFLAACLLGSLAAPAAQAAFGLKGFDVTFTAEKGEPVDQAGAHPFAMTTGFEANTVEDEVLGEVPDGMLRDLRIEQIAGLVGNPYATPRCSTLDFIEHSGVNPECPDSSAVGITKLEIAIPGSEPVPAPVYNLEPPPGVVAKLGFWAISVPVAIELGLQDGKPYAVVAKIVNTPQPVAFFGSETTLWGNPADPEHDGDRGDCASTSEGSCPADIAEKPFLTLPRSCDGPLTTRYEADSWAEPGNWVGGLLETHDDAVPPNPHGFTGCDKLGLAARISAQPTTASAESPTGLDFGLNVDDEGLVNPAGTAGSDIEKAAVTLPAGMTLNPSQAEGLGVCGEAQLAREKAGTAPGDGCPEQSKIGTIEVQTPLLENHTLSGALYVAAPYANPFGSLIAFYMVFRSPALGIVVTQAAKVVPDPATGRLTAIADDIPQLPFSSFRLRFREGARSPLVTPPDCGSHTVEAELTPRANPTRVQHVSTEFQVTSGAGGGPCPPAGAPPFAPGFEAGSINNDAGSFSPFYMRLTRRDGDQDMTKFSAVLPPGLLGRLAGVSECPAAQIALARTKTGIAEQRSPSCPSNSRIGATTAGAGVGSVLTYVPGELYLAGPYNGAPLSVVAITPAVAGPYDVGTVVVRVALDLDPVTGQVHVDGSRSDPIPHILAGIVLKLRDLRVNVDRSGFTLNPTSCAPSTVAAELFGSAADVFDPADDSPVSRSARYQAASCASLGFKPRLGLRLKGGTRRGAHPAFRAVLRPRHGDANTKRTIVRLPRSAFLEQAHIRTVCTRVQFAADACPKGSVYGHVVAHTPLLDQPLRGPAYLRSSSHKLPDLVFDLHGIVDIEASARIDSIHGGIRASFASIPDAPLSKVIVNMQGGKKGLIVNSRNLCAAKNRAAVRLDAHNGKRLKLNPVLQPRCKRAHRAKRSAHRRAG